MERWNIWNGLFNVFAFFSKTELVLGGPPRHTWNGLFDSGGGTPPAHLERFIRIWGI